MNTNRTLTRDKILGYALVILVLIASYFFLIRPSQQQEGELITQTQTNEARLVQLQEEQVRLQQEEQLVALEQAEAEQLAQRFPPSADPPTVTALVERVAVQSGVAVRSISVGSPKQLNPEGSTSTNADSGEGTEGAEGVAGGNPALGGDIFEVPITVTVIGTPIQTSVFIQNLETAERTIYTSGVTSNPTTNEDGTPSAASSQTIKGFTFLLPPLDVTPPPPVPTG